MAQELKPWGGQTLSTSKTTKREKQKHRETVRNRPRGQRGTRGRAWGLKEPKGPLWLQGEGEGRAEGILDVRQELRWWWVLKETGRYGACPF